MTIYDWIDIGCFAVFLGSLLYAMFRGDPVPEYRRDSQEEWYKYYGGNH